MSNAREIAMKVIYDVEFNGAYSNMALKKALKTDMPKQDKAFISNLVYGVTDRKLTLDYVIEKNIEVHSYNFENGNISDNVYG